MRIQFCKRIEIVEREDTAGEGLFGVVGVLEENGIPAPEEARYELANGVNEVIAEIELAWISRKIGYMTKDQQKDREKAENAGWKIFITADEIDTIFEGE